MRKDAIRTAIMACTVGSYVCESWQDFTDVCEGFGVSLVKAEEEIVLDDEKIEHLITINADGNVITQKVENIIDGFLYANASTRQKAIIMARQLALAEMGRNMFKKLECNND